ncbi:uncharacterized protein LOC108909861 isoform X1 [Anoplophora glabripennis]|uniref:uncharacterized protein LOC108909861 isoform X1 n=1 Tax=Anoplophora glabripennis TaxID=217634 RepID=UPI000874AF31|nr:uncharacterized protein LOC108909861 isoform X1 [Anoplophora glabripennis]
MSEHKIEKLQEVLSGYIKKSQIISDKKITNLTAPGENFGSVMLKLDITLKDEKDGTEEELHAVAKMIPARESQRTLFNIQVTFKNEIGMYNVIAPTLRDFQRENGINQVIDCFPEFYGARINLDERNGTVDEDAVLILENLSIKGYGVVDRHVGFDLETAQLILKDLAAFHAIPLALKLRKPEVFESKIRPYLARFVRPSSPHNEQLYSTFIEIFQESNKCVPWMPKMKEVLKINETLQNAAPREPFSTIIHGDAWVNNIMLKFQNRLPVGDKLIDFQICDYNSPAIDVFFFLFTSVQLSVLQDNFDGLIEFYHKHFISHLEKLKCDTAPFSLPKFLEEMKAATPFHLLHTIFMLLLVVFGKKEGSSIDFDPELLLENDRVRANIIPAGKEKVWYLIHTCGTRGWLE